RATSSAWSDRGPPAEVLAAGLTMTQRQPSMLAVMSIPPATGQAQGPAIQVQGLEKSYKELRVLRGVDLDVARGSIFALLGSNGAGEATVVKRLSNAAGGRHGDCPPALLWRLADET